MPATSSPATVPLFVRVTGYRLQCEQEATGNELVGWQRWRRQPLEQTRDKAIVFAQGVYDIFRIAEYFLLLGARLKDLRPEIKTHQH